MRNGRKLEQGAPCPACGKGQVYRKGQTLRWSTWRCRQCGQEWIAPDRTPEPETAGAA